MAKYNSKISDNAIKHTNKPLTEIRRTQNAIHDQEEIKDLLKRGAYGTLASTHQDQPYITPLTYVYIEEDHALYFHGAKVGRLRGSLEINPKVCFNVTEVGRMIPDEEAVGFGIEYRSVIVFGTVARVIEDELVGRLLQALMDKYVPHLKPGEGYPPISSEQIKGTAVYKISIDAWSGKEEIDDPDCEGAYYYQPLPIIKF
jgi:nitroimidazol reductase NimA-like FMN-containing flavoprotein (pyridoxamine 5'-phosphate oxidase superfamily)